MYLFQGLSMYSGVDWAGVKLIQVLAEQLQALICWVITVEPETSIAGVIIPAVEVLQQRTDWNHQDRLLPMPNSLSVYTSHKVACVSRQLEAWYAYSFLHACMHHKCKSEPGLGLGTYYGVLCILLKRNIMT